MSTEEGTVQFAFESSWDSIVNHNSLDMEEEELFRDFVLNMGIDPSSGSLQQLESLYEDWRIEPK